MYGKCFKKVDYIYYKIVIFAPGEGGHYRVYL
jgi:hypothetical protein